MTDNLGTYETLLVSVSEHVATVALNRPEAMNAINATMCNDLIRAFSELDADIDTWAVVLSGAGRAFSVGADLKERQGMSLPRVRNRMQLALQACDAIARCRKPVIAAIHGYALGGGWELALSCDLMVASESAVFAMPETSLGIIPGSGGTQRLTRLIGPLLARELVFTARRVPAPKLLEYGGLNLVVPDAELAEQVMGLAREITANAPVALQQAKKAINVGLDLDLASGVVLENEAYQTCLTSADRDEGLAAFREKRKPNYRGV